MACPVCSYTNDEVFHFCQNCGYKRRTFTTDVPPKKRLRCSVDESEIKARLDILAQKKEATSYVKQKSALELELSEFSSYLQRPKNISSALPNFLFGRMGTVALLFIKLTVSFSALKARLPCDCPKHLAKGTVDSVIGKLRSIFSTHDRVGDWNAVLGIGNPAASKDVKDYFIYQALLLNSCKLELRLFRQLLCYFPM